MSQIYSYLICIVMLCLLYILGACLRTLVNQSSFVVNSRNIFLNLFSGMILLITCYSILLAKGKTINWLFVVMGILYYVTIRHFSHNKGFDSKVSRVYPISFYFISLIFWTLFLFIYLNNRNCWGTDSFRPIEIDNYFTSQLSQFLNRGFENTYFYENYFEEKLPTPYHYCETWLSSFIYKVFGINALYSYSVILPVVLLTILLFGYLPLIKNRISLLVLPVLLLSFLFISDISIFLKNILGDLIYYPNRGQIIIQSKMTFVAIFFLVGIFFLKEKNYLALFYSQLLLLPVSIIVTPAVCSVIGITLLIKIFKSKEVDLKYCVPFLIMILLYSIYVYGGLSASISLTEDSSIPWEKLRLLITNPISYLVRYSLWLLFILLIDWCSVFNVIKLYRFQIVIFFIATTLFSVLLRGKNHDAAQFVSAVNPAILSVLLPSTILILWHKNRALGSLFLCHNINIVA